MASSLKNLLVNGKNKVTAKDLASRIQNLKNTASNPKTVTSPNLPTQSALSGLKMASKTTTTPVVQSTPTVQPGTITSNNPAYQNGALKASSTNQVMNTAGSRFIGFQNNNNGLSTDLAGNIIGKSGNVLKTAQQGKSWAVESSKPILNIPTKAGEIKAENEKYDKEYKERENLIRQLHWDIKNANGQLTKEDITKKYKQWKGKEDAVLQLQADLRPLIQQGQYGNMNDIQKYYPELLQAKKQADETALKEQEEMNKNLTELSAKADKILSRYNTLSNNGVKVLEDYKQLSEYADYLKKNYRLVGDNITDADIINFAKESIPEVKQLVDEIQQLEMNFNLTDEDRNVLYENGFDIGDWLLQAGADIQDFTQNNQLANYLRNNSAKRSSQLKDLGFNASSADTLGNLPSKALSIGSIPVNMLGELAGGVGQVDTALERIAKQQNRNEDGTIDTNGVIKDVVMGGGGAMTVGWNTVMAIPTAIYNLANETEAGAALTDKTIGKTDRGLDKLLSGKTLEGVGLDDNSIAERYNAQDEQTQAEVRKILLTAIFHKGSKGIGKLKKLGNFEIKAVEKALGDLAKQKITIETNSPSFKAKVEQGLADGLMKITDDGILTDKNGNNIGKVKVRKMKTGEKVKYVVDKVLSINRAAWNARSLGELNPNALPDNRTFEEKADRWAYEKGEQAGKIYNSAKEGVENVKENLNKGAYNAGKGAREIVDTAKEGIENIKNKVTNKNATSQKSEMQEQQQGLKEQSLEQEQAGQNNGELKITNDTQKIEKSKTGGTLSEKVYDKLTGLDEATRERMKANPYSATENKNLIDTMESDTAFDFNEYQTNRYQNVLDTIVDKLEQKENTRKNEVGPLYQKLEETNAPIDTTNIKNQSTKFRDKVAENDGIISSSEQTKINKLLDAIDSLGDGTTDIWKIRRMADQWAKWDSESTTDGIRLIREIRDAIDDEIRVQRPEMKEVDTEYRKIKDEIADLRGNLINKKSGKLRDNAVSTVKNLLNPSNKQFLDRLEKEIPGITKQLQAIRDSKFVYNAYQTGNGSRFISGIARGTLGNMFKAVGVITGGIPGLLFGALLDKAVDNALVSLTRKALKATITEMTPKAQAELESIMKKVQEGKELTAKEKAKLKEIENKIVENAENAKKTKAEQEAWDNFLNKVKKDAKSLKLPDKGGTDGGKNILTNGKTIITDAQGNSKVKGQISEVDKRPSKPEDTTPPSKPTTPTKPTEPKNKITNKTPKKKSESKPKAVKTEDRSDLKSILGEKLYNKLQQQLDLVNESRKGNKEPITMEEMLRGSTEYYLNMFNKMAHDELSEISDKLSKITDGMEDTHLTEDQQSQLAKAKSKKQREALLNKWREEYWERNKFTDEQREQVEKLMLEANELVKQHDKIRAFFRDIMNEKTEMALQKGYENKVAEELYNETTGLAEKQNKADIALYDEMNAENDAIVDLFDEMKREEEFEKNLSENETPQDIRDMEEQIDYLDNILQNETLQITEAEAPQNKATTTAKNKITNVKVTKGGDIRPDNSGITGKFRNLTLKDYKTMQEVEGLEDEYLKGDAELIRNMEQLRDTMYYFDPTDWDLPEDFEIDYNNGYVKDRAKFVAENQQLLDRIEKGKTTKEDIDEYEDYYDEEKKTRDTDGIIKWQKDLISEMFENSVDEAYPSNEFLDKFYDRYLDFLGDRELRETNEKLNNFGVMFNKYNRWWNQGKDYSPSQREYRAKQDFERAMNENETPQITEEETPKNKVTAKTPEKPKDLVTNSEFQTLPEDVSVWREQKKNGPKRIAPDRISWQQLTYEDGAKRIMEDIKKIARHIELQREFKKPSASRTDTRPLSEINSELLQTGREVGNILGKNWLYKSTRSQEFKDLWRAIANANNDPSILAGIGKDFYEKKVKHDLSKGYIYPDEVIDKIPGAKKAADARQRYQKGLDTSFSSKDERIDYSAKDKIGGGMKRQDGKPLTEEQKNEIVKGVVDFQKTFAINMKKMAEDLGIVYVHVNGKKVFMSKASGMFKREYNDDGTLKNASISVGGVETVRWKDEETGEWKTESANTIMSHELGHVVDYVVDRNLIVGRDITDLWTTYKRPENNHSGYAAYLRRDKEVIARAFEQYLDVAKGGNNYYDKVGYWSKDKFEKLVKPILERNIKEKLGDWYINPEDVKFQKNKVLSNAKNKITSTEKKAESKMKKKIEKDMDQLMKTGLVKGYQFVQSTKDLFNLINGTTEQARYQSVWHGSPAKFDRFDSSHMGEGEGAQAHGWGHYVAVEEGTARHYAEMGEGTQFRNRRLSVYNGLEDDIAIQVAERLDQDYSFDDAIRSVKEDLQMDIDEFSEYKGQEQKVKDLKKQLKLLDEMKEEDFTEGKKNLYEVEIPDPVKANTPTGSNYLEEDGEITKVQMDKIYDEVVNEYEKKKQGKAKRVQNLQDGRLKTFRNLIDQAPGMLSDGKGLYSTLSNVLGGQEQASKFLESLGYDGIHYFGGSDGEAYVIFNDNALEITNHIQYLKDNQGNIAGATLPDGTVIFVEDALRADTAWHETSHRLYSFAKENSPELYNAINKIAQEAPQELKDYVKETYGDMSPESFIDEVFAWQQGKYSAIKGTQTWYQRMWEAVKRLWNNIKSKFGKEYADLSVFEGWEKMNSEQLMKEVDNLLKGGKKVGEGKGSLRYEQAGTNSPEFKKWFKGSKVVNEDGTPKIMYHGTPNKGFNVFKEGYFTENKEYADHYQNANASSLRFNKKADNPGTYAVYLDIKNPFDTRDAKAKKIFEEEYYGTYGMGTPLGDKGLPDWMDGTDLQEFIIEKHPEYDGLILDEGGIGGYGEKVEDRGVSYVPFKPNQIKSATDNIGTYDKNNPDIRYQRTQNRVIKGTDKDMRDNLSKMMRTMRNNAIAGGLSVPKYNNGGQLENALRTIWRINSDKDMIQDNNTYGDVLDDKVDGMMQIVNIIDHGNNNENIHYKRFYDPLGNENYKQTLIFWKGNTIEDALSQANPPVRDVHLGITNQTKKSINKFRKPNGKLDRTPMRSRIGHRNQKPISSRIVINQKKQS